MHRDRSWRGVCAQDTIKHLTDLSPVLRNPASRIVPTPAIYDRQDPKRSPVGQGIMHKIHALAFGRPARDRGGATMQCDMLATPDSHAELQAIQAIRSSEALAIHRPTLTPQPHPNPQVPKPRPGMSPNENTQPQGGVILRATPSMQEERPNCAN